MGKLGTWAENAGAETREGLKNLPYYGGSANHRCRAGTETEIKIKVKIGNKARGLRSEDLSYITGVNAT